MLLHSESGGWPLLAFLIAAYVVDTDPQWVGEEPELLRTVYRAATVISNSAVCSSSHNSTKSDRDRGSGASTSGRTGDTARRGTRKGASAPEKNSTVARASGSSTRALLQLLYPLDPLPTQQRYLQYVSRGLSTAQVAPAPPDAHRGEGTQGQLGTDLPVHPSVAEGTPRGAVTTEAARGGADDTGKAGKGLVSFGRRGELRVRRSGARETVPRVSKRSRGSDRGVYRGSGGHLQAHGKWEGEGEGFLGPPVRPRRVLFEKGRDRMLELDCILLHTVPVFDEREGGGCRPVVRVFGTDPGLPGSRVSGLLFSSDMTGSTPYYSRVCPGRIC